jgi:2-(1,2-epoxy-1,2-dihydrophenyl)acetyl-CoA isomerase
MSEPPVIRELTDDGILIITLNKPDTMNALNRDISNGIEKAMRETKENDDVRVLVITGTGRGFCAGADLSSGGPARSAGDSPSRSQMVDKVGPARIPEAIADADVPIIGAINGAAAGAGFGLALCCDIRIASDQARLGTIFIKRGVAPDWATSYWLPRIVGLPKAFELFYSGQLLNAEEALAVGVVNQVVPHESLMEEALAYARMIATGPPIAYTYTRRALVQSSENDLHRQLVLEWTQQTETLNTNDAREGFKAFIEKRDPVFKGD